MDPVGNERAQGPIMGMPGTSFATGAGANAGMSLLIEGMNFAQQSDFKSTYGSSFGRIRAKVPGDVDGMVFKAVDETLDGHWFFGPRLGKSSPKRINLTILRHGLVRCGKRDSEVLVSPSIFGMWELNTANGRILASGNIAAASPSQQGTVSEFAANPADLRRGYAEAAERVAAAIVADLDDRLGPLMNFDRGKVPAPERQGDAKATGAVPVRLTDLTSAVQLNANYKFTRNFNTLTRQPTQSYLVQGERLLIAGTESGGVLMVMAKPGLVTGSRARLGDEFHKALREVLNSKGIEIARQRDLRYFGIGVGHILELTGDGESALASYMG